MINNDKPHYEVERRYGYSAIDLYRGDRCIRAVVVGLTDKLAEQIAGELNEALEEGRRSR
jgi:hypothetical protein